MTILLVIIFIALILILINTIHNIYKIGNNKKHDEKIAEELFKGYINHFEKGFYSLDDSEKDKLFYQGIIKTYKKQVETSKKVLKNNKLILIIGHITILVCAVSLTMSFLNKSYLMALFLAVAIVINIILIESLKRSAKRLKDNIHDIEKYIKNNLAEYMDSELKSKFKDIK